MDLLINKILMRARCLGESDAPPVKWCRLIRHEFASRMSWFTANPCTVFSRIYISHGDILNEVMTVVPHLHSINHSWSVCKMFCVAPQTPIRSFFVVHSNVEVNGIWILQNDVLCTVVIRHLTFLKHWVCGSGTRRVIW